MFRVKESVGLRNLSHLLTERRTYYVYVRITNTLRIRVSYRYKLSEIPILIFLNKRQNIYINHTLAGYSSAERL